MEAYDADRDKVIRRAESSGLAALITIGSTYESSLQSITLSEKYDIVYASIGIHPHDAASFTENMILDLTQWAKKAKVVAIGETGLDYYYNHSPQPTQREVFGHHIRLSRETGLPLIVHSRDASGDTMKMLRTAGVNKGVMHCFSGDIPMAEEAMALGFYISFAGPVTFRKASRLKETARIIPDEYILVETDAPYLAPEPFRGKRNEPSYMTETVKFLAELREVSFEDMSRITTLNARRLFGIGIISEKPEIAYKIRDSLYLNITNRCTNKCSFCVKYRTEYVKGHRLRLEHEPTEDEIRNEIGDPSVYKEVVFCGYGEPLQRLETVKNISRWIKERGGRVRINTNGHANLIHKRNVIPELQGIVDRISVSLDAHDEKTYDRLCKPLFRNAYGEVISFIQQAIKIIPEVQVTVVDLPEVNIEKCRDIAEKLGATFRVRSFNVVG